VGVATGRNGPVTLFIGDVRPSVPPPRDAVGLSDGVRGGCRSGKSALIEIQTDRDANRRVRERLGEAVAAETEE
jgi:hypothetical protein